MHIEPKYLKPAVWRRVFGPASIKLPKLHVVLLWAMGQDGGHRHQFVFGDMNYGMPDPDFTSDLWMVNEARGSLDTALGALTSFTYIYDCGDNWKHRVKIAKVLPADPDLRSPICLDGLDACPSEGIGDVPDYIKLLDAIIYPTHDEQQLLLDCCGGGFDPAAFDLQGVNEHLFEIKFRSSRRSRMSLTAISSTCAVIRAPRFSGHANETPWGVLHAAYFNSYALWTYLDQPFLYTWRALRQKNWNRKIKTVKPGADRK